VVRQRSAKPSFPGSNPGGASSSVMLHLIHESSLWWFVNFFALNRPAQKAGRTYFCKGNRAHDKVIHSQIRAQSSRKHGAFVDIVDKNRLLIHKFYEIGVNYQFFIVFGGITAGLQLDEKDILEYFFCLWTV
jgi:hypothetical protein